MGIRLHVRSSWSNHTGNPDLSYEFDQDRVVIGRGLGSDVCLPHRAVSQRHAEIRVEQGKYVVQDQGSTNGTRVNRSPLVAGRSKPLKNGDLIELGGFALSFEAGIAIGSPTSAERTAALARRIIREALAHGANTPNPTLTITKGHQRDETFELEVGRPTRIGRADECEIVLNDADTSREHVEVLRDAEGVLVRDLGSKNGLLVNGRDCDEKRLHDGDQLQVGSTTLVFRDPADALIQSLESEPDLEVAADGNVDSSSKFITDGVETQWAGSDSMSSDPRSREATGRGPRSHANPPRPARSRPSNGLGADLIIYLLAAIVFAFSLAGLVVLLSSG